MCAPQGRLLVSICTDQGLEAFIASSGLYKRVPGGIDTNREGWALEVANGKHVFAQAETEVLEKEAWYMVLAENGVAIRQAPSTGAHSQKGDPRGQARR